MVQIYSETNTNYEYNGDVVLDPEVCDLKVTLNGSWEVTLECPLDEQNKFQSILTNAVLCTDTPIGKKQLFRLYDVQRTEIGVIAYARPIFLDSARDVFFPDCRPTDLDGQAALDYLMKGTPYSGYTDIKLTKTAYYVRKNLIEALAGNEDNSFLNRWGGEITYDNYKINILVQQGEDNGLRVEFGTNIQSIQETIDVDEMGTRLVPVAFNGRTLDGDEPWVDSPLIDNYPIVYTKIVEFDDMRLLEDFYADEDGNYDESEMEDYEVFDTLAELQQAMIERCKQLFLDGIDLPAITYNVDMLDLRIADDYKDYQDLETVNLGDTVYCYHRKLGIETKARVIEYTYDCIRQCITSLTIGDYQEDYLDHLADITSSSGGTVDFTQIWDRFDYIEANYVKTNQLEAEVGKFGYLTVAEADITYARITDLEAALIQVNELIADQIYAVYADIGVLDASVANIISLLGGDIATGTLDTIHLTADNAVIDSEVVIQAIIEEAIIGDLLAGVIYTDYVTIMDNENGDMVLTGPTIQFKDSEGNYRMQVGLDGAGNFNIYIFDELGNLLFDALGLTEAGLIGNGAIIRDVAVADDANISGYKLNIQEVAECLTVDGTLIVDAGQVIIDGSTLSAVYTEIRQDVNTALTDAEKALEAAGGLIEVGARNYLLNTRQLDMEEDKTVYSDTDWTLSQDESDYGVLEENGNGSVLMLTAISAEKNSLSGKKMVFATDLVEENLTSILDDYDLEFGIYKSDDGGETWKEYGVINSTMNEDTVFEFNRSDLSDNEWCRLIAKFTANAEHMHTTSKDPVFTWDDDNMTCTATYTCDSCGEIIVEDCDVQEETIEATCEDDGSITYTATVTIGGVEYSNEKVVVIPATGHSYGEPYDVLWSSDYSKCTFYFVCTLCGEKYEEAVTPEHETVEATCTENGKTTYTAKCTINGTIYTATTEVTIPALGHEYGEPVFDWADDYMSCKATISCIRGDDSETVECSIEMVTIAPSCTTDGMTTYTATAVFDGKTYTDEKTETIPATGHTYGDPTFTWTEGSKKAVIDIPYEPSGDIIESGQLGDDVWYDIYENGYCRVYGTGETYIYSPMDASNRSPLYQNNTIKVLVVEGDITAINDSIFLQSTVEIVFMQNSKVNLIAANSFQQCTALKTVVFSSELSKINSFAFNQDTALENIVFIGNALDSIDFAGSGSFIDVVATCYYPADNSTWDSFDFGDYGGTLTWQAIEYEYEDSGYTCTATFTCENCGDTQTVDCTITETRKDATCTENGSVAYTATAEFDDKTYTDVREETIPATGHDYGEPVFNWSDDYESCTATFTCKRGDDVQTVQCTVTVDGKEHTATAEFEGKAYTDIYIEPTVFAIYSADDSSLTFYTASDVPSVGDTYNNKVVTNIYTDFENSTWTGTSQNPWYSIRTSINSVEFDTSFKKATPVSMAYWFYGMTNLTDVINASNIETSSVTTLLRTFESCSKLTTLDLSTWDVSSVTTLQFTFGECSGLTALDVSKWDVSSVTDMQYTFYSCPSLTTLDVSTWDVSNVTTLYQTFYNCSSLTTLDVSTWDVSSVTTLYYTFRGCSGLTALDVSTWDVSSVTTLYGTFYGCSGLTALDVSTWDVSSVTTLRFTFRGCSGLTALDVSTWDVSNVTTLYQTFYNCSSLTTLDVSTWDVSSVTTLYYTFYGCSGLTTLDVSSWNTAKVSDMRFMFYGCSNLVTIYSDDNVFVTSGISNSSNGNYMFQNCSKLVGGNGTAYDSSNYTYAMAHVDTASNPGYFTDIADKP